MFALAPIGPDAVSRLVQLPACVSLYDPMPGYSSTSRSFLARLPSDLPGRSPVLALSVFFSVFSLLSEWQGGRLVPLPPGTALAIQPRALSPRFFDIALPPVNPPQDRV